LQNLQHKTQAVIKISYKVLVASRNIIVLIGTDAGKHSKAENAGVVF
jgi:hypothetical protein